MVRRLVDSAATRARCCRSGLLPSSVVPEALTFPATNRWRRRSYLCSPGRSGGGRCKQSTSRQRWRRCANYSELLKVALQAQHKENFDDIESSGYSQIFSTMQHACSKSGCCDLVRKTRSSPALIRHDRACAVGFYIVGIYIERCRRRVRFCSR